MDATSADTRIIHVHDDPTKEMLAIDERMTKTTEKLEADFWKLESKIQRFPRGLRGIGGQDERYIVPSLVAIGPYHHGSPHLRKMEEVKLAAAYHLCRGSGHSTIDVYQQILSIVGDARGYYDADDSSVTRLSDADFAAMMFLDGCFLMQYIDPVFENRMTLSTGVFENRMTLSTGPSILKDIFLLENQIPWLVLEALMQFMPVRDVQQNNANARVRGNIAKLGDRFFPKEQKKGWWLRFQESLMKQHQTPDAIIYEAYQPPHILGLLRYTQVWSMPHGVVHYKGISSSLSSSAVELAQMGVVLAASAETWFGDISVRYKGRFLAKMSLSPVFLNEVTACWLVNMAALEASTAASSDHDGFVVSSFLSVFAMIMARKEDVHELRGKRLLQSTFSNKQTLGFFKDLGKHLRFGGRYFATMEQIEAYKRHRPVRIAVHRLVYKHYRTIATILSIAGVLVGIFKALLSPK